MGKKVYTKKQQRCRRSHKERMSNKHALLSKTYGLVGSNSIKSETSYFHSNQDKYI